MTEPEFTTEELESEEWRPIPWTEGCYSVSSLGRIRRDVSRTSGKAGTMRVQRMHRDGYPFIHLFYNGKMSAGMSHKVIAEAFIGPRPKGYFVNHIDGVKHNNRAVNLEYVTAKENMEHASRMGLLSHGDSHWMKQQGFVCHISGEQNINAKLTDAIVREMRLKYDAAVSASILRPYGIIGSLAARYGIDRHTVRLVVRRKAWCHVD